MKLILSNNQSKRFVDFYTDLQQKSSESFDYSGYQELLFIFDTSGKRPVEMLSLTTGKHLVDYDGVYINGYLNVYELAAATAIACQANDIGFVNQELSNPASLSKLSMYAKLAAAGVHVPRTIAGTKYALMHAGKLLTDLPYPAVLKRADADRGIDNFKVASAGDVSKLLADYEDTSLWLIQEYIENDGFYLVSFYGGQPVFSIFRSLEKRPDHDPLKEHMYKPAGGANASLVELEDLPSMVAHSCQKAVQAMERQIASVDCLFDKNSGQVHVLEVNYNPQLVTIETFKDIRIKAFLDNLAGLGNPTE